MNNQDRIKIGEPDGGQFIGHSRTDSAVNLIEPHTAENDPTGENRAAEGAPGTWGATPEMWTRIDRAAVALEAGPGRKLTGYEQRGWDSLNGIESTLDLRAQPLGWCAWKIGESLRFARSAGERNLSPAPEFWNARIERLTKIKDALWELADEEAVAAER